MLTTDLIRVRRSKGKLVVPPLKKPERDRLLAAAERYLAIVRAHVGQSRGELDAACEAVEGASTDYKRIQGLLKLIHDRCEFEVREDLDPPSLRREIFSRAAKARSALSDGEAFDPEAILGAVGGPLGLDPLETERALFADLKEHQRLIAFADLSAAALVDGYQRAQEQAVLLRAVKVTVWLRCAEPAAYRAFFHQLKFRRLLYRIQSATDGGYRIDIDGPFGLFQASTKYGLQLALLLPALERAGEWQLEAEVRWGKEREPMRFELEGRHPGEGEPVRLADEVEQLRERFAKLDSPWRVEVASALLELPGEGLCVPDLVFTHRESGERIYLEVMGYWSRDAVWRRVELVRAGLPTPILFAVSSRLRVSEEVLGDELPGQLYVYKGSMNAKRIAERLTAMSS